MSERDTFGRNVLLSAIAALAIAPAIGAIATENTYNSPNNRCDVELSSPLSWYVCPVVDTGSAVKDTVFSLITSELK